MEDGSESKSRGRWIEKNWWSLNSSGSIMGCEGAPSGWDAARGTSVAIRGGDATEGVVCVSSGFSSGEGALGMLPLAAGEAGEESGASGEAAAGSFALFTATTGFAGLCELK